MLVLDLVEPSENHVRQLMAWFTDEASVRAWGGPPFRYPFSEESFLEDVRLDTMNSYALVAASGSMVGFGQTYRKLGRGHLARLVVAPEYRGRGYGSVLAKKLIRKAEELFSCSEHSLYVLRVNSIAIHCYENAGFREASYPDEDDTESVQLFMVR